MKIKDRRIEISADEAVALATRDVEVECVGEEGGFISFWDVLADFSFFAPESALAKPPKPSTPEEVTAALAAHVDSTPDSPEEEAAVPFEEIPAPKKYPDELIGAIGLMRKKPGWTYDKLSQYFGLGSQTVTNLISVYQTDPERYDKAAVPYDLPDTLRGRVTWKSVKKKKKEAKK